MNLTINWLAIIPLAIVLGAGVVGTLLEAFLPRNIRRAVQIALSLLALGSAFVAIIWRWSDLAGAKTPGMLRPLSFSKGAAFSGVSLVEDGFSILGQTVIVVCAFLSFMLIADRTSLRDGSFAASAATRPGSAAEQESTEAGREQTEIFPLALFATGGMMAFVSAFDLLSLFIALELLSLPLYVLSATARRRRLLSQEAALKYFLLGAFSSAIFLMGAAFIYGATGTLSFYGVAVLAQKQQIIALFLAIGVILLVVGLLFKVGAAPFHSWTPDVYQGAPTPITAFMAAGTKTAAFIAMVRVFVWIVMAVPDTFRIFMWIIIIATVVIGTVMGLVQTDIKRLLAYSSIAHAGFILIAVKATLAHVQGIQLAALNSIVFYLLAYGLATVGAFGVVTLIRSKDSEGNILGEATSLSNWAGLGKRSPFLASAMVIFLLSFAGIPLTAGFIGKFEAFATGIAAGDVVLVVIAIIASVATAFFYFRLIQLMFFTEAEEDTIEIATSEGLSVVAISVALAGTIVLGIFPSPILEFIAGTFQ
ncbi:NADH-quinone oxidoreductase subunit NuoN [Arcanobacterium haemolyticum]|uniref:NADH-quinone oxidoreductase subunit N n=1 Tax=Arcanobacterium haemolyticum (strain ATCC 9345 / DSM 20595 / CCM 5947 / CCUG 17215 / LMG 16163 / NBRC 15585 / NCTC 8452 / 11018) TaxID=644284 RepID=D7BMB5_ARCHD|nr:NADH-quinone oxidoreductase subunit NuoN [Arcanobacterium haemolyticum]ADH92064.1 proton-translocating NADH-quinone oxidoreductase, chain N [Arcanobacterium haemolyticum DSM 20595]QCX46236.1 NADH-quinone oxidoreductase subunit NuoN [Arcanobacterium haemolyticum]SQH29232.1 NADH-quinone oxidoreductase subunit N [Arcanobacterium haemolyticum]